MTTNEVDLEALAVLQAHQLWRRGGDGPATDPTELGKAIDSVISELTARRARDAEAGPGAEGWRMAVQESRQWGNVDDANAIQQRAIELAKQP